MSIPQAVGLTGLVLLPSGFALWATAEFVADERLKDFYEWGGRVVMGLTPVLWIAAIWMEAL